MTNEDDMSVYSDPVHMYGACAIALGDLFRKPTVFVLSFSCLRQNYMVSPSFRGNVIAVSLGVEVI